MSDAPGGAGEHRPRQRRDAVRRDLPPTPAVDRDAAPGGLGLHMLAKVAGTLGWARTADVRRAAAAGRA